MLLKTATERQLLIATPKYLYFLLFFPPRKVLFAARCGHSVDSVSFVFVQWIAAALFCVSNVSSSELDFGWAESAFLGAKCSHLHGRAGLRWSNDDIVFDFDLLSSCFFFRLQVSCNVFGFFFCWIGKKITESSFLLGLWTRRATICCPNGTKGRSKLLHMQFKTTTTALETSRVSTLKRISQISPFRQDGTTLLALRFDKRLWDVMDVTYNSSFL